MCGICGELRFDGNPADVGAVATMAGCMVRRGPDGDGLIARGPVALGHRRLKIIDLSEAAQQPMVDAALGLTIVYNGAIYNYPELRQSLQAKGYTFFSHGDTEVLLKAYHAWGVDFVKRLNGMFAFAIHERDSGRVILGRDRLGIKPLYYAEAPGRLRFCSSLPAMLKAGDVDTSIDPQALNYYLTFHSVVPPPHTILQGIRKLPPATVAVIEADGKRRDTVYWEPHHCRREAFAGFSREDYIEATLEVMRKAVKRRLIADVPVGVLLSGGLDSSLIVGLLCEHADASVETFSIGFESVNNEAGDEFQYSDIIASRFNTNHHKLFIDAANTLPALKECVSYMSEPMVSHDNVGFFLLSREVAKFVKVVQSGQGADEIFAGYHWYPPMLQSTDPVADYARHFFDRDFAEYCETVDPRFVGSDHALDFVRNHFDQSGAELPIDKALRIDSRIMLADDPVKRVDNHTMASSLEARVPFLDHEVVEFAAALPPEMKVPDDGKYILREAARRVIPKEVIDRPKGYFPVPALKYLQGEFLTMAKDTLLNDTARQRKLYNPAYVENILRDPEAHITPLRGSKLWQLALLELWLQTHQI